MLTSTVGQTKWLKKIKPSQVRARCCCTKPPNAISLLDFLANVQLLTVIWQKRPGWGLITLLTWGYWTDRSIALWLALLTATRILPQASLSLPAWHLKTPRGSFLLRRKTHPGFQTDEDSKCPGADRHTGPSGGRKEKEVDWELELCPCNVLE